MRHYTKGYIRPIDLDDIWGGNGEGTAEPKPASVPKKHFKMEAVEQWTIGFEKKIARYRSVREASNITGITYHNIKGVLNGYHKKAGGYYWKYEESGETLPEKDMADSQPLDLLAAMIQEMPYGE